MPLRSLVRMARNDVLRQACNYLFRVSVGRPDWPQRMDRRKMDVVGQHRTGAQHLRTSDYDAVVPFVQSGRRADVHAGRIRAVITAENGKEAAGVRPLTLLDVLDPGPVNAERHLVFGLARDGARVAADARGLVDDESVPQRAPLSVLVPTPQAFSTTK